ncbi:MAG: HlyD family efflux transporter periplasmic adaptor subunit [Blastochloris sp.]|nr:HlyD family efflux transporter periplasmic adaptor subunit [Blastochloris sp.]
MLLLSLFLFLYPWPFRVAGTFTLKTSDTVFVPAPFEGYLGKVDFREGDQVKKGEMVLRLDQRELLLQEAEALADSERFRNEARSALSQNRLAEMRSAASQAEQAEAKLQITRMKLAQSEIRAPYDGMIVESDLHERLGRPIQKGEVLFRIAKLEGSYGEIHVEQEDIGAVRAEARGRLAFASRPENRFGFVVERVHPAAVMKDNKNVFLVRVKLEEGPESWWRPGMTGVAKIEAGRRPLAWIWSRRALDHIRLKYLWW